MDRVYLRRVRMFSAGLVSGSSIFRAEKYIIRNYPDFAYSLSHAIKVKLIDGWRDHWMGET